MKKIGCLGLVLVCGIVLSGCSSADTSKLEEKLDKITKNVDGLHEKVDELSENGLAANSSESSSEEETEESTKEETKETKDSSKTKESSETKESKESSNASDKIKGTVVEDDKVKLTITDVKFVGNILSTSQSESEVMAVIYYTIENLGSEKFTPNMTTNYYIDALEEDDISEDSLYASNNVQYYEDFEKLYDNTELSIKSGAKIDGITSYQISTKEKSLNINVFSSYSDRSIAASQTYTPAEISKDVKKNEKIKPKF